MTQSNTQAEPSLSVWFTSQLMAWHQLHNRRQMPWKGEQDPYRIWLSEIILQQTRVAQGLAYYERFVVAYPTVHQLAAAPDDEVLKLWEGLGYYARCRNLLHTARSIVHGHHGQFPSTYEGLLQLKGVGAYTAAAIASFAYQLPHAVVDGNVIRVLARVHGVQAAFDTAAGRQALDALAQQCLDTTAPAAYNQAIMDFGATVCKPVQPACPACPLHSRCTAYLQGMVHQLPYRSKRIEKKERFLHFVILRYQGKLWLQQRLHKDIWHRLYAFYTLEYPQRSLWKKADIEAWLHENQMEATHVQQANGTYSQTLTHRIVHAAFTTVELAAMPQGLPPGGIWIEDGALANYALPVIIRSYLEVQQVPQQQLFLPFL